LPCDGRDLACAEQLIDDLGARAFRRPLTAGERDDLVAVYELGAPESFEAGVQLVIEAILQAPSFLYRTELGGGDAAPGEVVELTAYELAASVSFLLLDSIPDAPLWAAAQDGSLLDDDVLRDEVERLLALPRVRDNLARIYVAWLGATKAATTDKSSTLFPEFDEALRDASVEETRRFVATLVAEEGTLFELLTSRRTEINGALAELYGVPGVTGAQFVEVELPASQRAGVLTQASMMATRAGPEETSVVHRGLMVQKLLLCAELPAPPPGVDLDDPDLEGMDQRELAEFRAGVTACAACHALIDPFGLAFEHYDAIGRHRASVDASADLPGLGEVNDALPMLEALAEDPRVADCVVEKIVTYSLGRKLGNDDGCELDQLQERFTEADGSLVEPFRAVVGSDAFRLRKVPR
jgi:hypothetical protein